MTFISVDLVTASVFACLTSKHSGSDSHRSSYCVVDFSLYPDTPNPDHKFLPPPAVQGAIHPQDIKEPAHMERVHALLERNTAALNMAYTPY